MASEERRWKTSPQALRSGRTIAGGRFGSTRLRSTAVCTRVANVVRVAGQVLGREGAEFLMVQVPQKCPHATERVRGRVGRFVGAQLFPGGDQGPGRVPSDLLVPPDGVYAGWARDRRAAVSIGTNPHFDGVERRVEAHLLDFDGYLYGERLVVEIWSSIREQRRFDSLEQLVAAIGGDVERTRTAVRPG